MLRRAIVAVMLFAGAASTALALRGAFVSGVHWDAGIDTQAYLDITSVQPGSTLQQAYDAVFWTSEFYGTLVQHLADLLRAALTGADERLGPDSRETYVWQGIVTVVIAAAGAAGLSSAIGRVTGSALAGAFAWALLWTVPLYAGMSHLNAKDTPVAAGLSLVSAGMMLALQQRVTRADVVASLALAALGGALAVGQRGGSWPLVLALGGSAVVVAAARSWRSRSAASIGLASGGVAAALAAGIAAVWATNPIARIDLPRWLLDAYGVARAYPLELTIRTAGTDVNSLDLPWWYVPAWLGAQLPVLASMAVIAGVVAWAAAVLRPAKGMRSVSVAFVPLLVQGIAFPAVIVALDGTLYNGIRHVLFIVPALAGIAAFPVAWLDRRRPWSRGASGIVIAWMLLPVLLGGIAIVRWFPYAYAHVNPVADRLVPGRGWEIDAWGVSGAEGVLRLREAGQELVAVAPSDFPVKIVGGLAYETVTAQNPRTFGFYAFIVGDPKPLPPGCEEAFTIERAGQALGTGAVCRR